MLNQCEKKPSRRSARLNVDHVDGDSTPVACSRPNFDLNAFTPSRVRKTPVIASKKKVTGEGPSKPLKRKCKEKVVLEQDSDFEDEIPILKRCRLNQESKTSKPGVVDHGVDENSKGTKAKKGRGKQKKKPIKDKTKLGRWLSYVNFVVFSDISERFKELNILDMFKQSPFGYLLDLPEMRVQPQLLRSLMHNEVASDRKDMFIFKLNGSVIQFGISEFKAITGFKCGTLDDFVHELVGPSRLVQKYFPNIKSMGVPKDEFIRVFKDESFLIEIEDAFHMCILYFITIFILASPPQSTYVPEDHFLLVESSKYVNYPWGYQSFLDLRDSITSQMAADLDGDPDRVLLSGFPLALQYKFKDIIFMADELSVIGAEELQISNAPGPRRQDVQPPPSPPSNYHHVNLEDVDSSSKSGANKDEALERLGKEIFLVRQQLSTLEAKVDNHNKSESLERLEKELMLVRPQLATLEAKVDNHFSGIKLFIEESFKNFLLEMKNENSVLAKDCVEKEDNSSKDASRDSVLPNDPNSVHTHSGNVLGCEAPLYDVPEEIGQGAGINDEMLSNTGQARGVTHNTPTLDEFELPDISESQLVAMKNKIPYVTPVQQVRAKVPGKYAQSPYTGISDIAGTSVDAPAIFKSKHPFEEHTIFLMDSDLISQFQLWIKLRLSKRRGKKQSAFTLASNKISPPFDFGVDRVGLMDWFYDLVTTGRPWGDSHVDVIMYYLHKKMKYDPGNDTRVTFMDPFFIVWIEQIYDRWLKSNKDMRLITDNHEVAQYIRGFKIHANIPWELVDFVCVPINIPEACHWILAVICIKSRCIRVFDSLWMVGSKHVAAVNVVLKKLAQIIPLFFISTGYYGKRNDIDWKNMPEYMDKAACDTLEYVICERTPTQQEDSNDCGLYTCVFAEYISQGHMDMTSCFVDPILFRLRYGAMLWDYGTRKIDAGAVSDSEVTGKVVSRLGAPKVARKYISVSENTVPSK